MGNQRILSRFWVRDLGPRSGHRGPAGSRKETKATRLDFQTQFRVADETSIRYASRTKKMIDKNTITTIIIINIIIIKATNVHCHNVGGWLATEATSQLPSPSPRSSSSPWASDVHSCLGRKDRSLSRTRLRKHRMLNKYNWNVKRTQHVEKAIQ